MYDMKESGARIKALRLKKHVTQEKMADDLGVTIETVSRIERGARGASIDLLSMAAVYLNTTIDYLVNGKEADHDGELCSGLDAAKRAMVIAIMRCVIENI